MTDTYLIPVRSRPSTFEVDVPWHDATFATLAEVTDWLNYLENQGVMQHEFITAGDEFHVRWR